MAYFNKYIKADGADGLLKYKYACRDDSIVYKHITNRWFLFCLQFLPTWIAPNLVTFIGFCFTVFGHVYFMTFAGDGTGIFPLFFAPPQQKNYLYTFKSVIIINMSAAFRQ